MNIIAIVLAIIGTLCLVGIPITLYFQGLNKHIGAGELIGWTLLQIVYVWSLLVVGATWL